MPSQFPASFASAASAVSGNEGGAVRNTGGSGDWSRVRPNGATQTFRRPSVVNTSTAPRDSQGNVATPTTGVYVPPHMNSSYQSSTRNTSTDCRYSKDQLLEFYRSRSEATNLPRDVSELLIDGWSPSGHSSASNGAWSRRDDYKDGNPGPELCWEGHGAVVPLGLLELSDEERELFLTSVNSPLKPPPQNGNKEGAPTGTNGRKASISQGSGAPMQTGRPGPRRRETGDSLSGNALASPTGFTRGSRDEGQIATPPALLRRRTDFKDTFGQSIGDKGKNGDAPLDITPPFGSFKRSIIGPQSAGVNGLPSPWSSTPQSTGFPPMGTFGSFAMDGTGHPSTPGEKKGFGSLRGESRFKGLMSRDSAEDMPKLKDKSSVGNLEKLQETEPEQSSSRWATGQPVRPERKEPYSYTESKYVGGSAAMAGDESSPPAHGFFPQGMDQARPQDDIGFSSFGDSAEKSSFRDTMNRQEHIQQTPQSQHVGNFHDQMSPTDTNPYRSPPADRTGPIDGEGDDGEGSSMQHSLYSIPPHPAKPYNPGYGGASDRSHTSSAGPGRNYPSLGDMGGLGGLGGPGAWSAAPGAVGGTSRANPGFSSSFGDSFFGTMGDMQSSGAFGNAVPSNFGNVGAISRGSKMGSLFPSSMQDQMRNDPSFSGNPSSANAPGFGVPLRDTDSPTRHGRGMLDELFGNLDGRGRGGHSVSSPFAGSDGVQSAFSQAASQSSAQTPFSTASTAVGTPAVTATPGSFFGRSQETDPNQIPATQQRQMVMPDRMRWIYRDPQGTTQGPWSGLEMHDWYKAGFFSPELQVKKLEDSDYEPLAQLIRRIGNSREPFLVPQIGIPHGSATTQASTGGATLATASATTAGAQPGSAQPPFASSFPSFGTTLTAEQQNALERRKQEEQYLMAIQKEHLAQQQVMIKQMHMQGGPHGIHAQQLHHHSSAHSLQSQPSYGSITSPAGYQQSPAQGTMQQPGVISGFFDGQVRPPGPGLGAMGLAPDGMHLGREIEMAGSVDRLNMGRGMQPQYSVMPQALPSQDGLNHQQQVAAMLQDRARLQREQEQYDMQRGAAHGDGSENMDRLEQYHHLRAQDGPGSHALQSGVIGRPKTGDSPVAEEQPEKPDPAQTAHGHGEIEPAQKRSDPISAQPAQTSSTLQPASVPTQSPWATIETTLPMPSPPPQSPSPLPAPSAQRHRQHIIDSLALESRSRSQTPSMDTPSATLAPWAKDSQDSPKGPSLKEIQAVEAKKTAEQELVAAAARRALAEQERLLSLQSVAPAPGLPSSANWASGASPATPTSAGASAWAKPLAGKQANATPAGATKKTLAQIQKEEETRKNRAAAAAAMNAANAAVATTALPGGKRYADLAGKVATPPSGPGGPWTTVGSGGSKLKSPAVPTAPAQKAISTGAAPNTILAARPKPHVPVRSNTTSTAPIQAANDEFQKWAKGALGTGLNKSINVDDFVRNLLQLPSEPEILSEAVYANSTTLDGRRFAEEFVRRRKLADKGVIPDASSNSNFSGEGKSAAGGWSEVAKKGPAPKEEPSNFKVVAKKRGKK